MSYLNLVAHQWKADLRSGVWGRKLALKILFGLFIVYMMGCLLIVGYVLDKIVLEVNPNVPAIATINQYLLYGFGLLFIARIFMQDVPLVSITPYLTLPIGKKKLIHYFLYKSLVSYFNWLPLLFFLPFLIKVMQPLPAISWLIALACTQLIINMAVLNIKRAMGDNFKLFGVLIGVIAAIGAAGALDLIPLKSISSAIYNPTVDTPFMATPVFLILAAGAYIFTHRSFLKNCYLDAIPEIKSEKMSQVEGKLAFLENFGDSGPLIMQELRLIFRNKRPRTVLLLSVFFLFYGFIFLAKSDIDKNPLSMLFGVYFITIMFLSNYGQFSYSWESSYWDGLLTWRINFEKMILAKVLFYNIIITISSILALPYVYYSINILWLLIAVWIYHLGINTYLFLLLTTQNKKKINLTKSATFNWEGTSGIQFLMILPLLLLPFVIFGPLALLISIKAGAIALAAVGLISLAFHKFWIREIASNLRKKKYLMAEGFRIQ